MTGWTSPTHIVLLLLIALLLFGAKRLPEIGRSLGRGMREFKESVTGNDTDEPDVHELPAASPEKPVAAARVREHDSL
jgi:sec-independent protein translocase protein TatA